MKVREAKGLFVISLLGPAFATRFGFTHCYMSYEEAFSCHNPSFLFSRIYSYKFSIYYKQSGHTRRRRIVPCLPALSFHLRISLCPEIAFNPRLLLHPITHAPRLGTPHPRRAVSLRGRLRSCQHYPRPSIFSRREESHGVPRFRAQRSAVLHAKHGV